jgi:diaminohydroxyphosphoribosylaminopyrimidine deaminase/5-amino-6-(5-phosphoribosylamino)uracil reductase
VVVTRSGRLPKNLHLFTDRHRDRTLVFHGQPLGEVIPALGARGVSHLLIEGGGQILTEAFRASLVNEVVFFIAPAVMGTVPRALGKLDAPLRLREVSYTPVGPDLLCRGLV